MDLYDFLRTSLKPPVSFIEEEDREVTMVIYRLTSVVVLDSIFQY
jgi:hypothetical protein